MKILNYIFTALTIFSLFTAPALAVDKPNNPVANPNLSTQSGALRSCQAKEAAIKNRSMHLTQLAQNMETKFDAIANRVENYYTTKVVPGGKTVPNYDALVADIQTKKTAASTALTKAQNDANNFSCSGNPKTQLTQFREDMQLTKSALKNYRTSIRNLIVAVHSQSGEKPSTQEASPSQ
ncbi:MAG TPA: hypothetical protein VLE91_00955 [Candidatus Saccharimonadales bacterium]|nr:hypothetical protein [Candidatus Saccharimonadales bacterium]